MQRIRQGLSSPTVRLLLLAALLLGFVAAPALALAGQTHSAMHDDRAAHDHAAAHADHDGSDDTGGLLHASMHASSCCGSLNAILPLPLAHSAGAIAPPPARPAYRGPLSTVPDDRFRPPIA